ncbi:hypothetical protein [Inovirus D_HF3_19]|nr:hypothetical protein [Inovirus D_HF3_19]
MVFPIFTNTPLILKISRNTLSAGGQERLLFPARLPRGERRRRQKEFVVLLKFDETTNYAN